jgi:hypothetical protein
MRVSSLWLGTRESTRPQTRVVGPLLWIGLLASLGCAPSYRLVHEGDRYFERCYGADFNAAISPHQKEACWQAWLTYYTKHQPAHRVDYAMGRIEALQSGEPAPELPGMVHAGHSGKELRADLDQADASAAHARPLEMATMMPDAGPIPNGCLHFCNEYESACNGRCDRGSLACSSNCERERSLCLNGCY